MVSEYRFEGSAADGVLGSARAQIALRSDHRWIYVEEVNGALQVWSGPPCVVCRKRGTRLMRCRLHKRVVMMAAQIDLL